ncbi:YsnF/AvaK domain-containing protein [Neobacillus sp. LXY-4]|uniref:YsnF/AvaK domain-containing protein n=1 Tax=Neobacillus sp. LXY-4 TaxID=3379826 RepID=UPI003EE13DD9
MADLFGLFGNESENTQNTSDTDTTNPKTESGTLQLHKEELDISKNSTNAGEVVLSKEIVEEKKEMDVPVTHEEVIIERRSINNEPTNGTIGTEETIRIPVSEEHVEVNKHVVTTGEVSAYKRAIEETQHISELLRREEARINTTGNVNLLSDENDPSLANENDTNETDRNNTLGDVNNFANVNGAGLTNPVDNNLTGDPNLS